MKLFSKLTSSLGGRRNNICCFHFGRCGSTLLAKMLGAHPQIDWKGEIFHGHHEREDRSATLDGLTLIRNHLRKSKADCLGLETKFQHLDENGLNLELREFVEGLRRLEFKSFIVLARRNYLRQAISIVRGQLTGSWHVSTKSEKPKYSAVELNIDCLNIGGHSAPMLDRFQALDHTYATSNKLFSDLGLRTLTLSYEDDLEKDPLAGYRKTLQFLELPHADVQVAVQKLESRPLCEILTNYDSVREHLLGTDYEWMCES